MNNVVDGLIQCWGCEPFDRLFQIVSKTAAVAYEKFIGLAFGLFVLLFTVYVVNAIWNNMKNGMSDPWMKNSVQKVFISSVLALGILGMGVSFPRLVGRVIFEPVAHFTLKYSQAMLRTTDEVVAVRVDYRPQPIDTETEQELFYTSALRDDMISIMATTTTMFQTYIKLGIAVMDAAFSWEAILGVGAFLKHIILFFIGMYIAWGFVKIFFKYCCYFADAIIAMALFAFFFPVSLVMLVFKDVQNVPKWFGEIGKNVGAAQIKNLINAIVTLGSVVLTYTVIIVIVTKFFSSVNSNVMDQLLAGNVYGDDLNMESVESLTLAGCVALIYVMNFIFAQIPEITKMILSAFSVQENKQHGEQIGTDLMNLSKIAVDNVVKAGTIIVSGGKSKKEDKKEEKKEEKKEGK